MNLKTKYMNAIKVMTIFIFLGVLISFRPAIKGQTVDCDIENTSFISGEELVYKLYYNWKFIWVPAGEIVFTVSEEGDEYKVTAIGKTYDSYNSLFEVNDYYETRLDKQTMRPKTFVRYVEEGNYRKFDSLYFDQSNNVVHSLNGKTKEVAEWKEYPINSCDLDLISVMYFLRNTDVDNYNPGDFMDINMFFDEENFPIHVVYDKKEKKKIKDLGKFETIQIQPQLIVGNIFKEGDVMKIWVSNDENKIPLMIESPISIGSVKAVLKSYSGLKHPLVKE